MQETHWGRKTRAARRSREVSRVDWCKVIISLSGHWHSTILMWIIIDCSDIVEDELSYDEVSNYISLLIA